MTIAENTKIWSQGTDTLNKKKSIILYNGSVGEVTPSIAKSCNFLFTFLFFDNVIHSLPLQSFLTEDRIMKTCFTT